MTNAFSGIPKLIVVAFAALFITGSNLASHQPIYPTPNGQLPYMQQIVHPAGWQ